MNIFFALVLVLMVTSSSHAAIPFTPAPLPYSMLVFRYDAARDVVIVSTRPLSPAQASTAQGYANALVCTPEVSFISDGGFRMASPLPAVSGANLAVNYGDYSAQGTLSNAEITQATASLQSWFWVPGTASVSIFGAGQPLAIPCIGVLPQPLPQTYHTYVVHPITGEVGYLTGSLQPGSLEEAAQLLQCRSIREVPALNGFLPLLPPDAEVSIDTEHLENGVLPVDLSSNFPLCETTRLAGIVLMCTQFPQVDFVQFTVCGSPVSQLFMRSNFGYPQSPYEMMLPADTAVIPCGSTLSALQLAVQQSAPRMVFAFGPALVWRDWASIVATPVDGCNPTDTYVLRWNGNGYCVRVRGNNLPAGQLMNRGVPSDAIIALRLPGWESLCLMGDRNRTRR